MSRLWQLTSPGYDFPDFSSWPLYAFLKVVFVNCTYTNKFVSWLYTDDYNSNIYFSFIFVSPMKCNIYTEHSHLFHITLQSLLFNKIQIRVCIININIFYLFVGKFKLSKQLPKGIFEHNINYIWISYVKKKKCKKKYWKVNQQLAINICSWKFKCYQKRDCHCDYIQERHSSVSAEFLYELLPIMFHFFIHKALHNSLFMLREDIKTVKQASPISPTKTTKQETVTVTTFKDNPVQ